MSTKYKCPNYLLFHPAVECDWIVCPEEVICYACGCYFEERVEVLNTDAVAVRLVAQSCIHPKIMCEYFETCQICNISKLLDSES